MSKKNKRPNAALKIPAKVSDLLILVRAIVNEIGKHTSLFAIPVPALSTVTNDTDDLANAEVKTKTHTPETFDTRDAALNVVVSDLRQLRNYVQNEADKETDPDAASEIIHSGGLRVKDLPVHVKLFLKAKLGTIAGTVALIAKANTEANRVSYEWQQSSDGASWTDLPDTTMAKTTAGPLAEGKYYFRFRSTTSKSRSEWSDATHILVPG